MVRKDNDVKLVADDKVDGAECFVVEITPKARPADADPIHKTLAWFRKDIGLSVKVASYNKNQKEIYSHTLLGMKVDVPIDAGRFVLKAPDGVEVTDLTSLDEKPTMTSPPKP
jgi:outer membrane lipoprotein-sorting protein